MTEPDTASPPHYRCAITGFPVLPLSYTTHRGIKHRVTMPQASRVTVLLGDRARLDGLWNSSGNVYEIHGAGGQPPRLLFAVGKDLDAGSAKMVLTDLAAPQLQAAGDDLPALWRSIEPNRALTWSPVQWCEEDRDFAAQAYRAKLDFVRGQAGARDLDGWCLRGRATERARLLHEAHACLAVSMDLQVPELRTLVAAFEDWSKDGTPLAPAAASLLARPPLDKLPALVALAGIAAAAQRCREAVNAAVIDAWHGERPAEPVDTLSLMFPPADSPRATGERPRLG